MKQDNRPQLIRNLWELILPYRSSVRKALLWVVINELLGMVEPLVFMVFVDQVTKQATTGAINKMTILLLVLGSLLAYAIIHSANMAKNSWTFRVVNQVEYDIQVDCAGKLLRMPLVYFQQENSGKIIGKLGRGVGRTIELIWSLTFDLLPVLATFVIAFFTVLILRYQSAIVLLPVLGIFVWMERRQKIATASLRKEKEDLYEDAQAGIAQAFDNILTTQACCQEEREHKKVTDYWGRARDLSDQEHRHDQRWHLGKQLLFQVAHVFVLLDCAWAVLSHQMTIGQLFLVVMLVNRIFGSSRNLSRMFQKMAQAEEPIRRTLEILHVRNSNLDGPRDYLREIPEQIHGSVEFSDVTYRYPKPTVDLDRTVRQGDVSLQTITCKTSAKETIAIVGPSGAGKSTLLKLLMRFDDPTVGDIRIDGLALKLIRPNDIRSWIGYVGRPQLFNATIAENIAYGRPRATDDEIHEAARQANADEFIARLPKGYREVVGNDGDKLSDGQKQRIVLARALIKNPPILLLDEPWSHLDAQSAWEIKRVIREQRGKRTIILVTHDLLALEDLVDRILVMDRGRLMEQGTHATLMRRNGLYSILHNRALVQAHALHPKLGFHGLN